MSIEARCILPTTELNYATFPDLYADLVHAKKAEIIQVIFLELIEATRRETQQEVEAVEIYVALSQKAFLIALYRASNADDERVQMKRFIDIISHRTALPREKVACMISSVL